MRSTPCRVVLGVLAVIAVCLAVSPSTQAGAPDKIPPFQFVIPQSPLASCTPYGYSFDVLVESTFYGSAKIFKDQSGNPVRTEYHWKTDDVFTNSVSGHFVVGHANYKESVDAVTEDSTFRGLFWHTTVPGVGNILQDAGFMIVSWDPFEVKVMKGTYQVNVGDFRELCAALD